MQGEDYEGDGEMTEEKKYVITESEFAEMLQLFRLYDVCPITVNALEAIVRDRSLEDEIVKATQREWERGYNDGCSSVTTDLNCLEVAAAKKACLGESIRWSTALNTLIATESKRVSGVAVDFVYSYRISQVIESLRSGDKEWQKRCLL